MTPEAAPGCTSTKLSPPHRSPARAAKYHGERQVEDVQLSSNSPLNSRDRLQHMGRWLQHTMTGGKMVQTPSNVGAKSWTPEFSNAWRPYVSNTFSHPQKKFFSQVYKSGGLHWWKTSNYGNFKTRFLVFKCPWQKPTVFACTTVWWLPHASNGVRSNKNNAAIKTPQVNVLFWVSTRRRSTGLLLII